jgi:hypothetical protein
VLIAAYITGRDDAEPLELMREALRCSLVSDGGPLFATSV